MEKFVYGSLLISVIILEIAGYGLLAARISAYLPAVILATAGLVASMLALLESRPLPAAPPSPQYYFYLFQTEKKETQYPPLYNDRRL